MHDVVQISFPAAADVVAAKRIRDSVMSSFAGMMGFEWRTTTNGRTGASVSKRTVAAWRTASCGVPEVVSLAQESERMKLDNEPFFVRF